MENAEVLNNLPGFPRGAPVTLPKVQKVKGGAEDLPSVGGDQAGDHPRNLKVPKAMGPDEMHLWVMKDMSGEVPKPLFFTFEKSQQSGGGATNCKRGIITPIFNR